MKTQRNILIAFLLNLLFSIFEFIGGMYTGSIAIASDALHDLGDAMSIGAAWWLEKKSVAPPNTKYTYGYARLSVIGGLLTTIILCVGSIIVVGNAIYRLLHPCALDYSGMIIFAVIGVIVNTIAAYVTHDGASLNQKAVNLHMLEDVFGWVIVLVGAIVMYFTNVPYIDSILSLITSGIILWHAFANLRNILQVFGEAAPDAIDVNEITNHLMCLDGVDDVHHIHIWTMDGNQHCATMHIVTQSEHHHIKHIIKEELAEHGIHHVTLELETPDEICHEKHCEPLKSSHCGHSHHHHHHHH